MKYGTWSAITFLTAMLSALIFGFTDDMYFGVWAVIFIVISAEHNVLDKLEGKR